MVISCPNVPTRATSSGRSRAKSCFARRAQQRQVALHAARDVQHDDEPDGLGRVVEQRDRLRLAFVAHLEVVPRERRDEPAVSIGHGDEDADGVARAAKDRLLRRAGAEHPENTRGKRSVREEPRHAHDSFIRRLAPHL